MMKLKIGTLVTSLVEVELLDGSVINIGDVGIVIDNELVAEEHFFTNFDYTILINGSELYVFEDEITPYT